MSKGLKRICMNCGMRFYDLDKSPIICPSCDTKFTGEEKTKARRGRASATPEVPVKEAVIKPVEEDEDDVEDIDADDDIVALDDDDANDDDNKDDKTLTIDSDPDDLDDPEDEPEDDLDDDDENDK